VMRESDRLSRLLSEFLDFARVRVARRAPIDLARTAIDAARLALAHPDRPQNVSVRCSAEEGFLFVEGDDDLLHRAVFNLILNAMQASEEGGEVVIAVAVATPEQLDVGNTFAQGGVALSVTDTGSGISPEIRDRLFDPFFTTKIGGSGLGLAVVQRAIDAHRGLVFVDSGNDGTCFTIVLPRAVRVTPPARPIISHSPATVLA
jgi:two-component system, NtrC family, sensor histidine kinase PilS